MNWNMVCSWSIKKQNLNPENSCCFIRRCKRSSLHRVCFIWVSNHWVFRLGLGPQGKMHCWNDYECTDPKNWDHSPLHIALNVCSISKFFVFLGLVWGSGKQGSQIKSKIRWVGWAVGTFFLLNSIMNRSSSRNSLWLSMTSDYYRYFKLRHPPYSPDLSPADFVCSLSWNVLWTE